MRLISRRENYEIVKMYIYNYIKYENGAINLIGENCQRKNLCFYLFTIFRFPITLFPPLNKEGESFNSRQITK